MLCERCDNSEATFHLTEISNDVQTELHLCMTCARRMKFKFRNDDDLSLKQVFSFLDDEEAADGDYCPDCGLSAADFLTDGRPGCPACYGHLKSVILQYSDEKHAYTGKVPKNYINVMNIVKSADADVSCSIDRLEINELEECLALAVSEERYEEAAELRDRIREVTSFETE